MPRSRLAFALVARGFHPTQAGPMSEALEQVNARYDIAPELSIYEPKRGDTSLGYTEGTGIHMNALWFSEPVEKLQAAAVRGNRNGDHRVASWHGGMVEPFHVTWHEAGHVLWNARLKDLSEFVRFAKDGYAAALREPRLAITGYSLADAGEFFAENFSAAHLTDGSNPQVAELRRLLEGLR